MSHKGLELLRHAIRHRSAAALVTPSAGAGEKLILRLLPPAAGEADDGQAIAAELKTGTWELIEALIESATPVRVMVRVKWAEISFPTVIVSAQRRLLARRVSLLMPSAPHIDVEQRRRTARERVPHAVRVQARLARGEPTDAAQPMLAADVLDLSWTGVRLCCRAADLPRGLAPGDPMSVLLAYKGAEQRLAARFRNREPAPNGGVRIGLEFDPPAQPNTPAGEPIRALIDLLTDLRLRQAAEKLTERTLGLAG